MKTKIDFKDRETKGLTDESLEVGTVFEYDINEYTVKRMVIEDFDTGNYCIMNQNYEIVSHFDSLYELNKYYQELISSLGFELRIISKMEVNVQETIKVDKLI